MEIPNDSDIEINELFDEQVRLYKKKLLSDVTNTPKKTENRKGMFLTDILKNQVICNRHVAFSSSNTKNIGEDIKDAETTDERFTEDSVNRKAENEKIAVDKSMSFIEDGARKKVVFEAGIIKNGASRVKECIREEGVVDNEGKTSRAESEFEFDVQRNQRKVTNEGDMSAKAEDSTKAVGGEYLLQRIQKELDEIRDAHRKSLLVKSTLIKAMEKELNELQQKFENKRRDEMKVLHEYYSKQFIARKEAYRDICKKKILEYKDILDDAYRKRVLECKKKYMEAVNKLKEQYRKKQQ